MFHFALSSVRRTRHTKPRESQVSQEVRASKNFHALSVYRNELVSAWAKHVYTSIWQLRRLSLQHNLKTSDFNRSPSAVNKSVNNYFALNGAVCSVLMICDERNAASPRRSVGHAAIILTPPCVILTQFLQDEFDARVVGICRFVGYVHFNVRIVGMHVVNAITSDDTVGALGFRPRELDGCSRDIARGEILRLCWRCKNKTRVPLYNKLSVTFPFRHQFTMSRRDKESNAGSRGLRNARMKSFCLSSALGRVFVSPRPRLSGRNYLIVVSNSAEVSIAGADCISIF